MPRTATELTAYATKAPTALQAEFAEWIEEETGKQFGTAKETAAFREGVRMAMALVMRFQKSRAGQPRAARASEEDTETAPPAKAAKKAAKKAAPAAETAPPAKKAAAAKKTAPPAKRTRRAAAAEPASDETEAPF